MKARSFLFTAYGFILLLNSCKSSHPQESICLIPKNYLGPVAIIFDVKEGVPPTEEDGKHVYLIPENGILKTQVEANLSIKGHEYFYVDKNGKREKIPYALSNGQEAIGKTTSDMDSSTIFATGEEMTATLNPQNQEKRCRLFVVSTRSGLDSVLVSKERLPFKLSGFDIWSKKQ